MPLFADSPVADFNNRSLDRVVSKIVAEFRRDHPELLRGARLGVSLVDLSTMADDPPYGGMNDLSEYFVASLAKVGAMYAAYQLRSFVKEQARAFDGIVETLLPSLEKTITPQIESQVPGLAKDHPALTKIFTASYSMNSQGCNIQFSSAIFDKTLDEIDTLEEKKSPSAFAETRKLGFQQRLELMIKWSSNCGACTCISDLGFQYINAALRKAGLFDPSSSTGLWLGAGYGSGCRGATVGRTNAIGNGRVPIVNKRAPDEVFQVATPRSVARMLRALAELKLVDAEASGGLGSIKDLLDKRWNKTTSPIGFGLGYDPDPDKMEPNSPIAVYSKLGIGESTVCDGALVMSGTRLTGPVNYIAVVLGAPSMPGQEFDEICKSIAVLAPYIERNLFETH